MLLKGADIIIKVLMEQGCDTVFGYPGVQIIDVYESLYKYSDSIRHILTAHEQGAVHAADGFARSSGKPGVVIATSGPGATNLVTGIATAYMDSVPLVLVTGNVARDQIGTDSFQEIDITGITLPITKHNYFVDDGNALADTVREAFVIASSGRPGPVLIDVPKDIQEGMFEYEEQPAQVRETLQSAKEQRIKKAAERINKAKRPYIYFGGGIVSSGAEEELKALAEKTDAPMGCSMMGLSAIPTDYPGFLGMQGVHGRYASTRAMQRADLIIALGVRFNDRATGEKFEYVKGADIVHIDIEGAEISKNTVDKFGMRGDLKLTLTEMMKHLRDSSRPEWKDEVAGYLKEEAESADSRPGFTPRNIIEEINGILDDDTPVVTDVGQHQVWAAQYIHLKKGRRFITSGGLGTMWFGLGAAIGAEISTGTRPVLLTGDGSFGMNLNELATAVKYEIPVTAVLFNNSALGMVRQWQDMYFEGHHSCTDLDRKTDFVALAEAFGAAGEKVDSLEGLASALEKAGGCKGPYLIECVIDSDEKVSPGMPG